MAGGRPRTVSLPKDDMIKLGQEMVEWLIKNSESKNILHLSEWYTIEKMFTYNEWKTMIVIPEFFPYYDKALRIIGKKYIDGTVHPSIAQRWQRVYFKDLRDEEDETAKFNSDLNANKSQQYTPEEIERAKRILDQVSRNQVVAKKEKDAKKGK